MGGVEVDDIDAFDALQTLAEVSIGVAGFTGVITVFRRRRGGEDDFTDTGVSLMLATSIAALFQSTFPLGLSLLKVSEPGLWRISSVSGALFLGAAMIDNRIRRARLPPRALRVLRARPWFGRFAACIGTLCILVLLLNALGVFASPDGAYFFAVFGTGGLSLTFFVRAGLRPQQDDSDRSAAQQGDEADVE